MLITHFFGCYINCRFCSIGKLSLQFLKNNFPFSVIPFFVLNIFSFLCFFVALRLFENFAFLCSFSLSLCLSFWFLFCPVVFFAFFNGIAVFYTLWTCRVSAPLTQKISVLPFCPLDSWLFCCRGQSCSLSVYFISLLLPCKIETLCPAHHYAILTNLGSFFHFPFLSFIVIILPFLPLCPFTAQLFSSMSSTVFSVGHSLFIAVVFVFPQSLTITSDQMYFNIQQAVVVKQEHE